MASREERMQQRLRGAQRRQVKDVDFGLVFPTAAAASDLPAAATQQSPQPELVQPDVAPQPSTRRTPATRSQPANISKSQGNSIPSIVHSANDANTSAKRRKLDTDLDPPSSGRSTRSSRNARPDIYSINGDDQQETSVGDLPNVSIEQLEATEAVVGPIAEETRASSPPEAARTPSLPAQMIDEVEESPADAPGNSQRLRTVVHAANITSLELQSLQESSPAGLETETPIPQRKRKRGERSTNTLPETTLRASRSQLNKVASAVSDIDELSPEQPIRRGRSARAVVEKPSPDLDEPSKASDEQEEAEAIDDEQAAALLKKNYAGGISRSVAAESPSLHEVEAPISPIAKKRKGKARIDSSPVKQRHPKVKQNAKQPASRKSGKRAKIRVGSPIPVTVHRLTRPLVYDEEEADADILNAEIPHTKRGGVNAIDVLSQICQEIVGAGLDTLEDGGNSCEDPALRREYKTKWRAVEAFGKELQTRLLEHTINLDNGYSLERRIRDEQKRKISLREEILRIRAEREQVALRMDEIRTKHEYEQQKAQERDTLNTAVHDIELAIERGKTAQFHNGPDHRGDLIGTDLLLKRVANEVSNKGDSGGMLRQIKQFNAFLERAALALEGRKA